MAKLVPTSTKRFGPRYGRRTKLQYGNIEEVYKKKQKCPYCQKMQVKRLSSGIWHCLKCDAKFTGKAYSI